MKSRKQIIKEAKEFIEDYYLFYTLQKKRLCAQNKDLQKKNVKQY